MNSFNKENNIPFLVLPKDKEYTIHRNKDFNIINGNLINYHSKTDIIKNSKVLDDNKYEIINISSNITSIDEHAFDHIKNNCIIIFESNDTKYDIKFIPKKKSLFICEHNKKNSLNELIIKKYIGKERNIDLYKYFTDYSITQINKNAFKDSISLEKIKITNNIIKIGKNAFKGCKSLKEVQINHLASWCTIIFENKYSNPLCYGSSLNYDCIGELSKIRFADYANISIISKYAFYNCGSLKEVELSSKVSYIGASAFTYRKGFNIYCDDIYSKPKSWDKNWINNNKNVHWKVSERKVKILKTFKKIGICSLISVLVLFIAFIAFAFLSTYITDKKDGKFQFKIDFDNEATIISYDGNDDEVIIPESFTYNNKNYFVKEIGEYLFADCKYLKRVTIPSCVQRIDNHAFYKCDSLTEVNYLGTVKDWCNIEFSDFSSNPLYNVKSNALRINGKEVTEITEEMLDGVTSIPDYAFYNCNSLTNITIPSSIISIGDHAFSNCPIEYANIPAIACSNIKNTKLKEAVVNSGDSIQDYAFYRCTSLTSITIPSSVQNIGDFAFSDCTSLTNITIPSSVQSIGSSAFYNCTSLTSIIVPSSIISIGDHAFYNCTSLASVSIEDGVMNIGEYAFSDCKSLTSLTIPSSVQIIKGYAFNNCKSLIIYCESDSQPNGWSNYWNSSIRSIYWGLSKKDVIEQDGMQFIIQDNKAILIRYNGNSTNVAIPTSITVQVKKFNVTTISHYAFYDCTSLTNIIIPSSVQNIGDFAFEYCTSLTSVTIPLSVESIGSFAFLNCTSLTRITIPSSVESIFGTSFSNCPIEYANIPSSLISYISKSKLKEIVINSGDSIPDSAFSDCTSLTNITIPSSVQSIGSSAFYHCTSLIEVNYLGTIKEWCNIELNNYYSNSLYYAKSNSLRINGEEVTKITEEMLDGVTRIPSYAFYHCTSLTRITIPSSVQSIGSSAFSNCPIEYANIPSSLISYIPKSKLKEVVINSGASIPSYAFEYCTSLTSITIPSSVQSIGISAFSNCPIEYANIPSSLISYIPKSKLKEVVINSGASILDFAFSDCTSLTNITIPSSVLSIGSYAFLNCTSLTSITIPSSVTNIPNHVFSSCTSLTSIIIPSSVLSIGEYAFAFCRSLTNITIPSSVQSMEDHAFYDCTSLASVTIEDGVTSIGEYAFYDCTSLASVTIGYGVTRIDEYAFYDCISLTNITIPSSVQNIGFAAFDYCTSITEVNYLGTIKDWCNIEFSNSISNPIYYAKSLKINGKELTEITEEMLEGVTSIPNYAFYNCTSLTNVTIPSSVLSIGSYAFLNCTSITEVNYLGTIKDWCNIEFCNSSSNSLYYAKSNALRINGEEVTEITEEMLDGVTSIPNSAFCNCTSLTSITIPLSVQSIGKYAFYNCTSITEVNYLGTIKDWCNIEFCNSSSNSLYYAKSNALRINGEEVTEITEEMLDGVTSIPNSAFCNCTSLTSIIIPSSVLSIGEYAFAFCRSLTNITIPSSVQSMEDHVFAFCRSLTSITIPSSVQNIGSYAFDYCTSLTEVNYLGTIKDWCNIEFSNSSSNPIYYAKSLKINGKELTEITEEMLEGVTSIPNYAFYNCTSLTRITIPSSVLSIGGFSFSYCNSLTDIIIPSNLQSIGQQAFDDCTSLTSIVIPSNLSTIEFGAFYNCTSLTIYCEATDKPSEWNDYWNYSNRPVYWKDQWHYDEYSKPVKNN